MRKSLLAPAAVLGLVLTAPLGVPALAQNTPAAPPAAMPDATGPSQSDGGAAPYLQAAQTAVQHHRAMAAREALERAETRMLDRSVMPASASEPNSTPAVQHISEALAAVQKQDWQAAGTHIADAMKTAQADSGAAPAMGGGTMPAGSTAAGMSGTPMMGNGTMGNGTMGSMGQQPPAGAATPAAPATGGSTPQ